MTKDCGLGHARERGVTGFARKTFHQLRRRVAVGGHHLSLATSPPLARHRNFSLRFCHEQSVSIFSSLQVLPSSHYFIAFQRNFCSLGEINLRFRDPPTSVWSRFRITSHGGSTSRPRNHYSSKTSLNADASKLVSIFFASVLKLICSAMKSLSIRRRWSS